VRLASSVEGLRGVKGATATATFTYDELVKIPLGRQECSHMVRPAALDAFRMAQDVMSGQGFV